MSDKYLLLATLIWVAPAMAASAEEPLFDPTRPLIQPASASTKGGALQAPSLPRLQAVFAQGRRHSALINGQRLAVGDTVGNYRITAIGTTGAKLVGPQGNIQLHLGLSSMKRLAQETKP